MPETTDTSRLSARFQQAFALAFALHHRQTRKGTDIPYISHLMAVAGLVLEHGGSEDEAIAALLHDAAEDLGGRPTLARIERELGGDVAGLVLALSDFVAEEGQESAPKEDWKTRKLRYLEHLPAASPSVRLIATADKLHNLRTLLADLDADGAAVWKRFNAPREAQVWFYGRFVQVVSACGENGLVAALGREVGRLERLR